MWAWDGSISAYTGLKQLQWYEEDTEVLRDRISSASRCQSVVGAELRSATVILIYSKAAVSWPGAIIAMRGR